MLVSAQVDIGWFAALFAALPSNSPSRKREWPNTKRRGPLSSSDLSRRLGA